MIATEGAKTEPDYFKGLNKYLKEQNPLISLEILEGGTASDPANVLKRMKKNLSKKTKQNPYEAWLVVDRDEWNEKKLNDLCSWAQKNENHHLALSNPKFEYWLLLHFEDGTGIKSPKDSSDRLKRHLSDYNKEGNSPKITLEGIKEAIERAKSRDKPQCVDWPRDPYKSTVYRLVERILFPDG